MSVSCIISNSTIKSLCCNDGSTAKSCSVPQPIVFDCMIDRLNMTTAEANRDLVCTPNSGTQAKLGKVWLMVGTVLLSAMVATAQDPLANKISAAIVADASTVSLGDSKSMGHILPTPSPFTPPVDNYTMVDVTYEVSGKLFHENSSTHPKRQGFTTDYWRHEYYIPYDTWEWYTAWDGHCDYTTYEAGTFCRSVHTEVATRFWVELSINWQDIISGTVGAERTVTRSNGVSHCVRSQCGCFRLWTQSLMVGTSGTAVTEEWEQDWNWGNPVGGPRLISRDAREHVVIDRGKKDGNGNLILVPGGSPCSDGPDRCWMKDWGCKCETDWHSCGW